MMPPWLVGSAPADGDGSACGADDTSAAGPAAAAGNVATPARTSAPVAPAHASATDTRRGSMPTTVTGRFTGLRRFRVAPVRPIVRGVL